MSLGSWFFGAICGAAICIATVPYAATYTRYQDLDLCGAYKAEVKRTMPSSIRKYLIDKPWDSLFINLAKGQRALEELASDAAELVVDQVIQQEGKHICYMQLYLNVALPHHFDQIHVEPVVALLNKMRW